MGQHRSDNNFGYYITMAPLAIDGKILVGTSEGVVGIRRGIGRETGEEVWRTYKSCSRRTGKSNLAGRVW